MTSAPPPGDSLVPNPTGEGLGFLLGLPRSGTTLLSVMLDRHPVIASPPEPWIMIALESFGKVDIRHPVNPQSLAKAIGDFTAVDRHRLMARAAATALYRDSLARLGKGFFLDKTPRYHIYADYIADIFPDARYVWLRRNPLDIAASYRTTWDCDLPGLIAGDADDPALFDLLIGLDRLERFHAAQGDRVLVVHYERLVADPAGELTRILGHFGLPASPEVVARMTELDGIGRTTQQFGDHKILGTTAPHTQSLDAWKTVFTSDQWRTLLEAVGSARLTRLGYGDTVAELKRLGVRDSGPELAAHFLERAERHLAARQSDIDRVTTFNAPLPGNVQQRVHAALAGDHAWRTLLAEMSGVAEMVAEARSQANAQAEKARAETERAMAEADRARAEAAKAAAEAAKARSDAEKAKAEADKARAETDRIRNDTERTRQDNERLRTQVAERDQRLLALLDSSSWRLTAPLRRLVGLLR